MKIDGMLASAFIGLINVIIGLIIIHFTPEDRPERNADRCDKCGHLQSH